MGNWAVIVQYQVGDSYTTEFICHGRETKDQALEELRAVLHTYLPTGNIRERWRHVYRFADRESYLVVIKGMTWKWECALRVAELISDSTDPTVAERALREDSAAEPADGPQDRPPPGC
ncbi:hypothetical protein RB628_26345 [Streptomyces sp. ADMS]|uniref:hypothetical protein n=1 Tax=Streptomyces sp. ADMS TaxID=3071415 RepID=UPI00296FEFAD|nr:hypothetical protein [Streptomyces sp. ADMS]MDW4908763.1 hypothetical protein [Streptomyces sp. ADMS]